MGCPLAFYLRHTLTLNARAIASQDMTTLNPSFPRKRESKPPSPFNQTT